MTSYARSRHRKKEKEVLENADRVITIAPFHRERLEALSGRKVNLITNGFDAEDFIEDGYSQTEKFTVRHIGIVDELRNPRPFMNAVKELCENNRTILQKIYIEFIGDVNSDFQNEIMNDNILSKITSFKSHVSHEMILELYKKTDLQLLILAHTSIAPGNLPGKFFEYMASGVPILAIGPEDGDAARIINETKCGVIHNRNAHETIMQSVNRYFEGWTKGEKPVSTDVSKYSRKNLTWQLSELLHSLK
ncbi:MAG: glycosyltransferase family 4 protein [Flammeovirgaceae bacterium]|nr:glycosyltransferase family 4 protein [Flammeovirgaceae bacterium]